MPNERRRYFININLNKYCLDFVIRIFFTFFLFVFHHRSTATSYNSYTKISLHTELQVAADFLLVNCIIFMSYPIFDVIRKKYVASRASTMKLS